MTNTNTNKKSNGSKTAIKAISSNKRRFEEFVQGLNEQYLENTSFAYNI